MELIQLNNNSDVNVSQIANTGANETAPSNTSVFIEANTIESSYDEIRNKHIIPVFIKDNEPLISQADFIMATMEIATEVFEGETILKPNVRLASGKRKNTGR